VSEMVSTAGRGLGLGALAAIYAEGDTIRADSGNVSTRMEEPRSVEAKSLDSPDAAWAFSDESERVAVQFRQAAIGRGVYRPGWRWSQHAQPLSGNESEEHIGYVISGRMAVRAKDGTEVEVGPGEAFIAAPGADAWVVGDEPCVALDFIATASAANR
jgi:quercetin dioxygenase-like cupin family protein